MLTYRTSLDNPLSRHVEQNVNQTFIFSLRPPCNIFNVIKILVLDLHICTLQLVYWWGNHHYSWEKHSSTYSIEISKWVSNCFILSWRVWSNGVLLLKRSAKDLKMLQKYSAKESMDFRKEWKALFDSLIPVYLFTVYYSFQLFII